MKSFVAALLAVGALCHATVFAQPSADAKARGQFNFYGRNARSAMRGARESTGSFREYVRSMQPASPQRARELSDEVVCSPRVVHVATDEIGDFITKSEKHLAWMRRQAEERQDAETLAALDSIDRSLAMAKQSHATLCRRCMADTLDANAAMTCCQTIDDALSKAISEHDALMKRRGEQQPDEK